MFLNNFNSNLIYGKYFINIPAPIPVKSKSACKFSAHRLSSKSVRNSAYPFAERSRATLKQTLPQPSRIELGALQLLLGRAAAQKQVGRIFCSSSKFSCRRRRRRQLAKLLGLVKACKQVQFSWQLEVSSVTLIQGRHSYLATCRCKWHVANRGSYLTPSLPVALLLTFGLSVSPHATTSSSSSTSDICL